ncbi:preprotein translocase subunit SecG [Candidatus Falkowbacteria bacterium RIFOXYB2_FULL_34_18]|uniref:Protein-export membrane protein SecG n=1 Tax=Candidatus Falkowbacteria bacterium RIFOXYD2_FULL_34_120 TaxID=1798007 RepID=A0A1F5TPZ0_9BACT|nr:MAG: preprotein translocase subunit SecG [Candidatus Falkowbacteria bacterium RIFOXYB2_FULL_34_18]OGF29368.1 MAG: preprotein translocase subunit SecG [Candidatus Falkowbacteria bacterium RIFOXYC12_FULL_34_55]OGF36559.1 MAG: preprotein translocase subunit SecG [Candidatus Falkowbacteria bacterium RIFOXYC2_FULL_34_220]OGF38791.1 MAG: preprotein translocase subunit SecG [Candidatus Falkowbacteria bacterium RIFOXYD12_FULL_34_57]OGF41032.1 MAG: preprotein translocase subunit SecG [Candidatus Falk
MNIIRILQLLIAVFLIVTILLQNRGGGLSGIFGGGDNVYMAKRGIEKKLFIATIVLSVLFFAISLFVTII